LGCLPHLSHSSTLLFRPLSFRFSTFGFVSFMSPMHFSSLHVGSTMPSGPEEGSAAASGLVRTRDPHVQPFTGRVALSRGLCTCPVLLAILVYRYCTVARAETVQQSLRTVARAETVQQLLRTVARAETVQQLLHTVPHE
jgi:hypothetical protein